MKTQEIVIIKTYDKEVFEVDITFEDWLSEKQARIDAGKKSIPLQKYKYELYFSNIKSAVGKTKYIALPAPKRPQTLLEMGSVEKKELKKKNPQKYYEMENQEQQCRANIQSIIKEQMANGEERRKKRFLENREEILKKLAQQERHYGLKTTQQKVVEWERFNTKAQKEKFKNLK